MRLAWTAAAIAALSAPSIAEATSSFSRKYQVGCNACHVAGAFPRLSYAGEKFMRNGYQDVGSEDGDEAGKTKIGDSLGLEDLGSFLGVRLNVVPVAYQTNAFQSRPGEYEDRVTVGNADWLQLFTSGAIARNVSVFIETEFTTDGDFHNSWFRLGFHNLLGKAGSGGLASLWVGQLNPLEFHAANGRLPMIPPARSEVFFVPSSGGKGNDSVTLRGARPGVAVFGTAGPLLYEIGIDSGGGKTDPNTDKNGWITLRGELPSGPLEGSSVSGWYYSGTDSLAVLDTSGALVTTQKNRFTRASVAANVRVAGVDATIAWVRGDDDNWTLAPPGAEDDTTFDGWFVQAGYPVTDRWHVAAQYDRIDSKDLPGLELEKLSGTVSFALREHFRVMVVPRVDLLPETDTHPKAQHEVVAMIRTMF